MGRFIEYVRGRVAIQEHLDLNSAEQSIRKNIKFAGPNVFILACAIVIASVGLNVNSVPVIIGAMLISPVMGPIMGFGFGLGTNDTNLVAASLINFFTMVFISLLASTLYFLITPLNLGNPTELLSRTNPTIYDVLIALFGGIAGMFEMSRKEHGTVLSGVAIATALMPPLCTVGYGFATGNFTFIRGAFYLFIINTVFISLAVFLTTKYLGFKNSVAENDKVRRHRSRIVFVTLLILIIPSVISAINVIKQNTFSVNAERFVTENKTIGSSYIFDYTINNTSDPYSLVLFLAGEKLEPQSIELLMRSAENNGLQRSQIVIRDEAASNNNAHTEVYKDLYDYYEHRIETLNKRIFDLEAELEMYRSTSSPEQIASPELVEGPAASPEPVEGNTLPEPAHR